MVVQLVFNPQSLAPHKDFDGDTARNAMSALIDVLKIVNDKSVFKIRFDTHLDSTSFMKDYSFLQWCKEYANRTEFRLILAFLMNKSKITVPAWVGLKSSEERIGKDYCFDEMVWALVYFFDFALFSLLTDSSWDTDIFECQYFDLTSGSEDTQLAFVRHASRGVHILQHKRIYYCHPKHCHHLPYSGKKGAKMDLVYEEDDGGNKEAEQVLSHAIQIPTKKQLIGFSKRTGKLYEFQPETPLTDKPWLGSQNRYHGYELTPEELHADVGGKIYREIIDSLHERAVIDHDTAERLRLH